jgi:DNA-binding response OmpR family regulator
MPQTILIVDDDTELCELLREYFELEGFDVRQAYDGEQALVESRRPGPEAPVAMVWAWLLPHLPSDAMAVAYQHPTVGKAVWRFW